MYLYQLKEEIARIEKSRGDMARTNISEVIVEPDFWGVEFIGAEDSKIIKLEDENKVLESDLDAAEDQIREFEYEIRDLERKLDTKDGELSNLEATIEDLKDQIHWLHCME